MNSELPGCARCPIEPQDRLCQKEDGKSPKYCPTLKNEEAITKSQLESSWVCASVMILYF